MIAITGIGTVSALGVGREGLMNGLLSGVSGLKESSAFGLPEVRLLGEVRGFDPKKFLPALKARRMSRFSLLTLASAIEAVEDSGLKIDRENPFRYGVVVGTGLSSTESTDAFYESLLEGGPLNQNPMVFPETVQNIAASHIAIYYGIRGPNTTFSQNEISSELALFYGIELLRDGCVDAVIVSGAEEMSAAVLKGFSALGMVSKKSGMMPFDRKRDGLVPSEGAATVVLERLEDAKKRNADIHATIASIGFSSEPAERLEYDCSGASMRAAMESALKSAGRMRVDALSAAANSSKRLDAAEARAIKDVFGGKVPVTALRAYAGFFISDGILRLSATALCMREKVMPHILNLASPVEDSVDFVIGEPRKGRRFESALINSFSGGGGAASVLIINPHI